MGYGSFVWAVLDSEPLRNPCEETLHYPNAGRTIRSAGAARAWAASPVTPGTSA